MPPYYTCLKTNKSSLEEKKKPVLMKLKTEMSVTTTGCSSLHFATLIHSKTISPSSAPDSLLLSHPKQTPITIAILGYVRKYVISSTVLNIFYRKKN